MGVGIPVALIALALPETIHKAQERGKRNAGHSIFCHEPNPNRRVA
jgi:hypothetical protein